MTDKIQEITQKIYQEGVDKAKADAEKIIADAKKEATEIVEKAKNDKNEITGQAEKEAQEIRKNVESEMQLAARQFTSKLKQRIVASITASPIEKPVKEAFDDKDFVKKIIHTAIEKWNPQQPEITGLKILLPEKDEQEFSEYFESEIHNMLNKTIEIGFDDKTRKGFKIGPKDGSYIISFSENDFENYFKNYFKERTRTLLFESGDKSEKD